MTDHITIGRTPPFVKDSSHPAPDAGMSRIPTTTPQVPGGAGMSTLQDHGHRGMPPTGFRTRDIKVAKGVNVVRVPEPIYDEDDVIVPCPYCVEYGARAERERLRGEAGRLPLMGEFYDDYERGTSWEALDRKDVLALFAPEAPTDDA